MSSWLIPMLAALAGAVATGALKTIDQFVERRRRRESTLVALASEVQSIRDLVELHGYPDQFRMLANAIRNDTWDGVIWTVDIQQNYFKVYDELASDLGLLKPKHVSKIVSFYAYCNSLIDQTRPDSAANSGDNPATPANILNTEGLLIAISALAEEIIALPDQPLPVLEDWRHDEADRLDDKSAAAAQTTIAK